MKDKGAKYRLNIIMVVAGMPFNGDTLKERSLGGSETAGLCMAKELCKRGHQVTVFSNCQGSEGEYDGVAYVDLKNAVNIIQKVPHDVLIVQRVPQLFGYSGAGKINVLWNHDLATKSGFMGHQAAAWNIDWVFLLSRFHVEQQRSVYSFLDDDHIRQTRNGIVLEDFPDGIKKDPKKIMYAARPERGLVNLVEPGGIMEMLLQVDPKITLYVAGYDNTTQQMAAYYDYLWQRCEALPNVIRLGHLTKKALYRHYAETSLYVYPTVFEEISCITAMECMATGTPFVTTRKGALPETLGEHTAVFLDDPNTLDLNTDMVPQPYREKFVGEVLRLLEDQDGLKKMAYKCRLRAKEFSWAGVAEQWEGYFYQHFEDMTRDKRRLAKHFLYFDDVVEAKALAEEEGFEDIKAEIEQKAGWAWKEISHKDYYAEFGEKEWQDRPEAHVARHYDTVFQGEKRWEVTKETLAELKIGPESKVLDIGCCCGWFSVGMANEFGCSVVGIDPCERYVKEAESLAEQRLKKGSVRFYRDYDPGWRQDRYDVIYIAEVLEHVGYEDPISFVKQFEPLLKDDGHFVITTPFGALKRIPAKGSVLHHDLHVRHFEWADIHDLFGQKKGFEIDIIYWQHTETTREICGWYLYKFQKQGPYGDIDTERKRTVQVPRNTVSVCMIARNEEAIIRRCLNSVRELADEIILADTGSSDRTRDIAAEYGAVIVQGSDPLEFGFETPRNESISGATGDWILWIDADEELQGENNLFKYLRNNIYKGYRIRQNHFNCQPQGAPSPVDKPVRLFRRDDKVRFWGLVHEHPGFDMNDGVGQVIELADVDIAHSGYYTEEGRRKKFWRNLPLMVKDIKKYPNRILGKYLYMRDLMHMARDTVEKAGGQVAPQARLYASEVVQIYRNLYLSMGGHMQIEGLGYYSAALRLLGEGEDIHWVIPDNGKPIVRFDRFGSKEEFHVFEKKLLQEVTWMNEGKYAY